MTSIPKSKSGGAIVTKDEGVNKGELSEVNFIGASVTAAKNGEQLDVTVQGSADPNTVNAQTGTTYALVDGDCGKTITLTNASAITVTVSKAIRAGFHCTLIQMGAGQVTYQAESGGTQRNGSTQTKSAGQYARQTIDCVSNADGASAVYVLAGQTGA